MENKIPILIGMYREIDELYWLLHGTVSDDNSLTELEKTEIDYEECYNIIENAIKEKYE